MVKGFTYKKEADGVLNLTSYASIFESENKWHPYLTLIEIGDEVFAIAQKIDKNSSERKLGIINPDGESLKGFDFNYNQILPVRGVKESLGTWFLVRKPDSDNYYFINAQGKFLSEEILPKADYSRNYSKTKFSTPYYIPNAVMGYAVNEGKIIDLYELKQIKTVPEDLKIIYLNSINLKYEPDNMELEEKRKNSLMFAVAEDETGKWMYVDFNGKKYLPQNN